MRNSSYINNLQDFKAWFYQNYTTRFEIYGGMSPIAKNMRTYFPGKDDDKMEIYPTDMAWDILIKSAAIHNDNVYTVRLMAKAKDYTNALTTQVLGSVFSQAAGGAQGPSSQLPQAYGQPMYGGINPNQSMHMMMQHMQEINQKNNELLRKEFEIKDLERELREKDHDIMHLQRLEPANGLERVLHLCDQYGVFEHVSGVVEKAKGAKIMSMVKKNAPKPAAVAGAAADVQNATETNTAAVADTPPPAPAPPSEEDKVAASSIMALSIEMSEANGMSLQEVAEALEGNKDLVAQFIAMAQGGQTEESEEDDEKEEA